MIHSVEDIRTYKEMRQLTAQSFQKCLHLLSQDKGAVSEVMLRDAWISALRESHAAFPDGWYSPPPYGISVIFGNTQTRRGYTFQTLRSPEMWPQEDVFFERGTGFLHVYASPVNRRTGIIGDFGMTVYWGEDKKIKSHLKRCLQINRAIFEYIQVGMAFREVYQFAMELLAANGLSNEITSMRDQAGTNIGHTIPALSLEERQILRSNHWDQIKSMIGAKRKFVSALEHQTYQPGTMVTIEPRPAVIGDTTIPMAWYHTPVIIHPDGTKEWLTGFDQIFKTTDMDYMLG